MAFAIGEEELERGLRMICIGSPLCDVVPGARAFLVLEGETRD